MPTPTPPPPIPPGFQVTFARSLRRAGASGEELQTVVDEAARDYAVEGQGCMAFWWALYADKGRMGGIRLQCLYVERHALTDLQRRLFEHVTFTEEASQNDSDVFKAVATMRNQADADIEQLEKQARASLPPAAGVMATTQPGPSPYPYAPDPNSPYYRGDPLVRPWRGGGW